MEILRDINQIFVALNKTLELDSSPTLDEGFVFEKMPALNIQNMAEEIKNTQIKPTNLENLALLIFQLNEYTIVFCNLCHLLLQAKKYDEVHFLVSKLFVAHIGKKFYSSKTACGSSERTFDRLVEIVYTAEIPDAVFVEFLTEIQKATTQRYAIWKAPALEYLQTYFLESDKRLTEFTQTNPDAKYLAYSAVLNITPSKGIDQLVRDYITNPNSCHEKVFLLLKDFKRETLLYIDNFLPKASQEESLKLVEILLAMSTDNEVMARVQDLYSSTKNPNLRALISTKLGISDTINIRTEKQFMYAVKRKIKDPQERSLGVPFDKFELRTVSGVLANNAVFSFIIFLFKEEKNLANLSKLKVLEEIFVKEDLQHFVQKMFETLMRKGDILQAKWCVRMFALLCANSSLDEVFNFLTKLLNELRNKEAKYLILALIYGKKVEIVDFLKESLEENQTFVRDCTDEFVDAISASLAMHKEDIKDMLVPNAFSIGEFDIQRDRLFDAFIAGKTYPLPLFYKMFVDNKIYNKLAQNLVFGEYRFGRLYNAFVLEGKDTKFIVGNTIFEGVQDKDADISIGIIHPLDMDFKFQKAENYFSSPTFDQFKPAKFVAEEQSVSSTSVNRFVGVMINPKKFLQYVESHRFVPNKRPDEEGFKSIVHTFPLLNIMAEVEFGRVFNESETHNSLAKICFYKISDTLQSQNKFLTEKTSALPLSNLPNRYFNYILTIIFEASKL